MSAFPHRSPESDRAAFGNITTISAAAGEPCSRFDRKLSLAPFHHRVRNREGLTPVIVLKTLEKAKGLA